MSAKFPAKVSNKFAISFFEFISKGSHNLKNNVKALVISMYCDWVNLYYKYYLNVFSIFFAPSLVLIC